MFLLETFMMDLMSADDALHIPTRCIKRMSETPMYDHIMEDKIANAINGNTSAKPKHPAVIMPSNVHQCNCRYSKDQRVEIIELKKPLTLTMM